MIRKIIHIDEEKCNGCGACVHRLPRGCHRSWWTARQSCMRDDYCDGLGDCLPGLPHRGHHL